MLNANEIIFLRWMHSECDWQQISYLADHDEYGDRDATMRWDTIWDEIKQCKEFALAEGIFDQEFLSRVDPAQIAEVIWQDDTDKFLGCLGRRDTSEQHDPHKVFAKARINKNWKYVTFDCVGLSVKDEPGLKQFHHMIEGIQTIVQAVLGRACKIIEVKAIH